MFSSAVYIARRSELRKNFTKGLLLFPGNNEIPMNYSANTFPFRQDSTFLYYWGLDEPGLFAIIDLDLNREIVFGDDRSLDDEIWMGPCPPLATRAAAAGVVETAPTTALSDYIASAMHAKRPIRFLPAYHADTKIIMGNFLGIYPQSLNNYASEEFIRAVIAQRLIKGPEEIDEIESALKISEAMYNEILKSLRPGMLEQELVGKIESIMISAGSRPSFSTILSIRGETLHNPIHTNRMQSGDLLLIDSGVESKCHYSSDITRTFPVSGKFEPRQKDVYEVVLRTQIKAIEMIRPEVSYKEVHLAAAETTAEGLIDLGLMKGDPSAAVAAGAHALFFPHGLGHALGLDAHDMENLGETSVGYDDDMIRSEQFGLAALRFARKLKAGHVVTVEPGIYFIPALIAAWKKEQKHTNFIDYSAVERYIGFGGIRIEDDVLVTKDGHHVLGDPIPKTIAQIEAAMAK